MRYRKRPLEIEAVQWTGENVNELISFAGDMIYICEGREKIEIVVKTLHGTEITNHGDFIIKGIKGEFYPCQQEIFKLTYEKTDG